MEKLQTTKEFSSGPKGLNCDRCSATELVLLEVNGMATLRCLRCKRDIPAKSVDWDSESIEKE